MKKTLLGLAISVITLGTFGHFFAKPLLAQVRAALVQNVDEPGRNPYQETHAFNFIGTGSCGVTICSVSFAPVPAGYRLVITSVSGRLEPSNATLQYLSLTPSRNSLAEVEVFVPAQVQGITNPSNGITTYIFNAQVQLYAEASEIPTFNVAVSQYPNAYDNEVTLTGYYVKL